MPHANVNGVKLWYTDTVGESANESAAPIVFVHEFAGDHRSWEAQIRFFARRRRCIAYNARGYPPSDVPADPASYSQEIVADDIVGVMDCLGIERAHLVGLSMGGFAVLHAGLRNPRRAHSLVVAGCGYGSERGWRAEFHETVEAMARALDDGGMGAAADDYARSGTRIQFRNKDPRGWAEFRDRLRAHSAAGAAATLRGYLKTRPSLYELEDALAALDVPALIVTGDEDEPCLEPSLFLKRSIPAAGLWVIPRAGHTINLEEPDPFNRGVAGFIAAVEAGAWKPRDPRSRGPAMRVPGRRPPPASDRSTS